MIGLDRLMKIKGVIAAGQFSDDGKVIRAAGALSAEAMAQTAQMCSSQKRRLETEVERYGEISAMNWAPLVGWAVWAGTHTIVVVGNMSI